MYSEKIRTHVTCIAYRYTKNLSQAKNGSSITNRETFVDRILSTGHYSHECTRKKNVVCRLEKQVANRDY